MALPPLKPFWYYYGGKARLAEAYPEPQHGTIIEPFAGAAGYSLRYPDRRVVLVERYAVIAELWRYLISVKQAEILRIPCVDHVDDLPPWVPQGVRYLVGFALSHGRNRPRARVSNLILYKRDRETGSNCYGWTEKMRSRVACQVDRIRHWRIIEGDYSNVLNATATWFVDPPYANSAGHCYVHGASSIDYKILSFWCLNRAGQVIVCENGNAQWLPFRPFALSRGMNAGYGRGAQKEVIWTNY